MTAVLSYCPPPISPFFWFLQDGSGVCECSGFMWRTLTLYPFCSARLPSEGRFPQMKSRASLLWHSGQPFGVPDVGNEIIHTHTVTECPSGTQEPCEIEAHRRELTFAMASHQQGCSQRERKRILGCERSRFTALFLCSLLSLASCTPS